MAPRGREGRTARIRSRSGRVQAGCSAHHWSANSSPTSRVCFATEGRVPSTQHHTE